MVNRPENWTRITGTIAAIRPADGKPTFTDLDVDVTATAAVEGFAAALSNPAGSTVVVRVPTALCNDLKLEPGLTIRARVRRPGRAALTFAHTRELEVERD